MSTAIVNARALRLPGASLVDWVVEDGGVIQAAGTGEPPATDRTVDADGAWLLPAFCDAHVHLPATGLYESGIDLRGETSVDAILDRFATLIDDRRTILFGGNFEDPLDRPLTRHELDRVVGDREALVARADMHSCVTSTALLKQLDLSDVEGVDVDDNGEPTGYLRERAAAAAWSRFDAGLSDEQQAEAVRAAARRAYSKGVAEVHEMFVVEWRGWRSLETFLATIEDLALRVVVYPGTDDVERVRAMGFDRIGGDYFLDGSFGSHSAWMTEGYVTPPPEGTPEQGIAYREDADLLEFFLEAQSRGLQVGVHAIGDAAIEQAIRTWESVADKVGITEVRPLGHRIEHFECASDDHIERARSLGLRASVQPAFDHFWGGPDGLYTDRIGWDRARLMNRFATMLNGGLLVGAGSDSTVTPLDPFLQVAALRTHHVADEQLGRIESLRLHTTGAYALAHGPGLRGTLEPGAPADLVFVDRDVVEPDSAEVGTVEVLQTWIAGRRVWPEEDRS
jgi:hypothetical protein